MSKEFHVIANWKMNGSQNDLRQYINSFSCILDKTYIPQNIKIIICPPVTSLHLVANWIDNYPYIAAGCQNCCSELQGAFTGELSASMLFDAGCRYFITGHSERRVLYAENNNTIRKKVHQVIKAGGTAIVCVGENLDEFNNNNTEQIVTTQLKESIPYEMENIHKNLMVAYEPVWAIGAEAPPPAERVSDVNAMILNTLKEHLGQERAACIPLLYGGSVSDSNASELSKAFKSCGFLLGRAGMFPEKIANIIHSLED